MIDRFHTKNGRVEVYEAMNGFYIRDSKTNEVRGMGDGVDLYMNEDGVSLEVGSRAFYTALRREVRENKWELMEAYFGVTR